MTQPAIPASPLGGQLARLGGARQAFRQLTPAIVAGAPWPLAERFGTEPEARWGPPEVLAHVAEMLLFWQGEIERILASPVEPAPFGRVATDAIRLATIERDRTLPARELLDRIDASAARLERRLRGLRPEQVARRGLHPARGEMTIVDLAERFVVSHLEDHAAQLREALG
jgi:hypothetical protein